LTLLSPALTTRSLDERRHRDLRAAGREVDAELGASRVHIIANVDNALRIVIAELLDIPCFGICQNAFFWVIAIREGY
jgi:hypothetical protein